MKADLFPARLLQATRLTRAGRLGEATAMLRNLLRGGADLMPELARDVAAAAAPVADFLAPAFEPPPHAAEAPSAEDLPNGAKFLDGVFTNETGSRPYKLYVPSRYRSRPVPLIVMLHGCSQSPEDFAAGTCMNALAEEKGFLVLYPGQIRAANVQKCWNWFKPKDQRRGEGEASIIAGMTRAVMDEYKIDRSRVFVAGLSAGGAAAAILGATYPDLYAAIGVHSGLAYGSARGMGSGFKAMREGRPGKGQHKISAIIFHGDQDQVVHPANAEALAAQFGPEPGAKVRTEQAVVPGGHGYTVTRQAAPDGVTRTEIWTVHGAGHAWSGGSRAGSYTDPLGPDASREMVRFFEAQSRLR